MGQNNIRARYARQMALFLVVCGAAMHPSPVMGERVDGEGCDPVKLGSPSPNSLPHGRIADHRISYLTVGQYICRWHLERRDPSAISSDVVHPIVYVIDKDVPAQWQPYFVQAVKAWLPEFEAIGFRNAMSVRVASAKDSGATNIVTLSMTNDEDPSAATGCVARATTGEMFLCTVSIHSGIIQKMGRLGCATWAGGDPTVPLPCPDSIIGPYLQGVITHEVGHTLGLGHNFYAPRVYPTDSLRSAAFVHKWGFTSSIMIHRGYDEVAQPEDHIPYQERWLRIGPYDRWALAWAYRPIPDAATPEAELPTLERWRAAQDTAAYLRIQVDNIRRGRDWGGDDDIRAIELWIRNAVRLSQRLAMKPATHGSQAVAPTDVPAEMRRKLDSIIVAGWRWRFGLLNLSLGGTIAQAPYPLNGPPSTIPIPVTRQLQVMRFILASALYGQDSLVRQQRSSIQGKLSSADSVPILFGLDTMGATSSSTAVYWQDAQRWLLEQMALHIPSMPTEARPEACRYLTNAIRDVTRIEAQSSPMLQTKAKELHTTLTYSFTHPGGCPSP